MLELYNGMTTLLPLNHTASIKGGREEQKGNAKDGSTQSELVHHPF